MSSYSAIMKLSEPKAFKADAYICHEGQPGSEMYIVLKGKVGVYITSPTGAQTEVATVAAGGFFGEMAIFDSRPRSASCVALEDTVCMAVNRKMLPKFIASCPEITMGMLENMSERIRKLNDEIYKNSAVAAEIPSVDFVIPDAYGHIHDVEAPFCDREYIEPISGSCPVCGSRITVSSVMRKNITIQGMDRDCRKHYKECEPLWFNVWSCPNCHYSNYYLHFFGLAPANKDMVKKQIEEKQNPVIEQADFLSTAFDMLFIRYIQAININEVINASDHLLLGTLWQNLFWLFDDAKNGEMRFLCAGKAANELCAAYRDSDKSIPDAYSRQTIALMLAGLYAFISQNDKALEFCDEVEKYPDARLKEQVRALREEIEVDR